MFFCKMFHKIRGAFRKIFLHSKTTKHLTIKYRLCIITFAIKYCADIAQVVECILGKDEVTGSNPVISSKTNPRSYNVNGVASCYSIIN